MSPPREAPAEPAATHDPRDVLSGCKVYLAQIPFSGYWPRFMVDLAERTERVTGDEFTEMLHKLAEMTPDGFWDGNPDAPISNGLPDFGKLGVLLDHAADQDEARGDTTWAEATRQFGRACRSLAPAGWAQRARQLDRRPTGRGTTDRRPARRSDRQASRRSAGTRRKKVTSGNRDDSSGKPGDDPPPPAQPQRRGDEQDYSGTEGRPRSTGGELKHVGGLVAEALDRLVATAAESIGARTVPR